jgi:hypothetical protein
MQAAAGAGRASTSFKRHTCINDKMVMIINRSLDIVANCIQVFCLKFLIRLGEVNIYILESELFHHIPLPVNSVLDVL